MEPLAQFPIAIPRRGSRSILNALHAQLRGGILDGRLKPGLRLPSTRALAGIYGISRNTAVAAYELLLSEGYVSARRGSGTTVAAALPRRSKSRGPEVRAHGEATFNRHWRGRSAPAPAYCALESRYSFQIGVPDPAGFPFDAWRRSCARVIRGMRAVPAHSFEPQGLGALREAISQHVSFSRAVACGPDDVLVTAGAQQAFDLLARVLTTPDATTVALEDPGYPPLRSAFAAQRARIAPVSVDAEGLVVEKLPLEARVVCVTPSHQFPLGAVMSARRRVALLDHCRQRGAVIIEDDYDGEFRFVDRPLDALQTLDRSQSVFYVGTFSKSLRPDLRLGYIVAPPWAVPTLVAAQLVGGGPPPTLMQDTLARVIRDGHLARHVRKMQRVYARRRDLLLAGLTAECGQWLEALPSVAGLHVAAKLAADRDEETVRSRAREMGVGIGTLRPFFVGRPTLRGLVLGFGAIQEQAIAPGLAALHRAIRTR
jgi:GntR family transcriptional regulator / MocR family aminotransferase